jgi:hypothetical protein
MTALEVAQAFGLTAVVIVIWGMLFGLLVVFGGPLFMRYLRFLEQKRQELKEEADES